MDTMSSSPPTKRPKISVTKNNDDAYFHSYDDLSVHAGMIGDSVRTNSYRLAILRCSDKILGKVVADVGAGTGILSCFCAQAGAKKVYAVEASAIANVAEEVIRHNKLEDKIELIRGRIEEVDLPEKVDVIVSEWMGYFLVFESMLNCVIFARDKWLKDGGIILPNMATMYLAPMRCDGGDDDDDDDDDDDVHVNDGGERDIWMSVKEKYGVDMSFLGQRVTENYTRKAHVLSIYGDQLISHPCKITTIDISTINQSDLCKIEGKFNFNCHGQAKLQGFVGWFSVSFPCDKEVTLSTSPYSLKTHWQQTALYLKKSEEVEQDTVINGNITIKPKCTRFLDIDLQYAIGPNQTITTQSYFMDGM
ncbi:protein arginine N-methyltransferase 6-like [Glandiceps talaboti]